MHPSIKHILNRMGIYHPLQSFYRTTVSSIQNKIYRQQYRKFAGSGFTCNVCGAAYICFIPDHPTVENRNAIEKNEVMAGYGKNIFCPNCMSTARERLVIAFLQDTFSMAGKKVLHLSPEKNVYHFLKAQKAMITTADLLPGFYKKIDGMIQKQDATSFSFPSESFDLVIANHILEHIPADVTAMREIYRVMKPGATAVLQVPYSEKIPATLEDTTINDPVLQSVLYGQKDHVRIYSLNDYIQRLKSAGLQVTVWGEEELQKFSKFALQPGEKLFKIKKIQG